MLDTSFEQALVKITPNKSISLQQSGRFGSRADSHFVKVAKNKQIYRFQLGWPALFQLGQASSHSVFGISKIVLNLLGDSGVYFGQTEWRLSSSRTADCGNRPRKGRKGGLLSAREACRRRWFPVSVL